MCKRIAIINRGKLVSEGPIKDIRDSLMISDVIHIYLNSYEKLDFLKRIPGVIHYGVSDGLFITVDSGKDRISSILSALKKDKRTVLDIEIKKPSLEEVFLTLVGRKSTLPMRIEEGYDAGGS
jgi:ABC-2 type transport system ATP-binding protein